MSALRFGLVSCANAVIDFALFTLLWPLLGVAPANVAGYVGGMVNGFAMNRAWTFRDARGSAPVQFGCFVAVNLGGVVLSTLLVWGLSPAIGAMAAKLFSYPITFVWNYGLSRAWAFRSAA